MGTAISPNPTRSGAVREFDELSYMASIQRYPVLDPDHEDRLARLWQSSKDKAASETMITSHLRLAAKIARRYRGYGFPLGELIAEANLGLVTALDHFDPDRGARFSTCAMWWIKSAIYDYVMRSWSLVRLGRTPAQKKLFFKLRSEIRRLQPDQRGGLEMNTAEQIARSLEVPLKDVIEMDQRLRGDLSLNAPTSNTDDPSEWQDLLADDTTDIEATFVMNEEQQKQRSALKAALVVLNQRERQIFTARHLQDSPASFESIGKHFLISAERVRQIDARAFSKVASAARRTFGNRTTVSFA